MWTQTGPVLAHLRSVYRDATNNLIIQENTTIAKWLNFICLNKYGKNPYYTCAKGHTCVDARFMACASRAQLPETAEHGREVQLIVKPRFTDFSIEPRLASAREGSKLRFKCRPTAWGVWDKLGSSAVQMSGAVVSRIGGSRIYMGPVF